MYEISRPNNLEDNSLIIVKVLLEMEMVYY